MLQAESPKQCIDRLAFFPPFKEYSEMMAESAVENLNRNVRERLSQQSILPHSGAV